MADEKLGGGGYIKNPMDYLAKWAKVGTVTIDKTHVTFSVKEGEGDDVFSFTLTGTRDTLEGSVRQITGYLLKASSVIEKVFNEFSEGAFKYEDVCLKDAPDPTADKSEFLILKRALDQYAPNPPDPVFQRKEFLEKLVKEEQGFEKGQDEGIAFEPNNFKE
jgi:hypothetical protein